MNATGNQSSLSPGEAWGVASSDVIMRVSWRDTAVFGSGFALGALVTECLVLACSRCRRKRRRASKEDAEDEDASTEGNDTGTML